ncbi:MAG: vWA domain-containing protein [Gaiella sp.]
MRLAIGDAPRYRTASLRTVALRAGLALAVAGLLLAGYSAASSSEAGPQEIAARGRTTVLVLDVSSSIRPKVFRQIDRTLERAVAEGGRLGVVLFSDNAYEMLPPGTPSRELEPLRRFFVPRADVPDGVPSIRVGKSRYVAAPWATTLTSGTRISAGLDLAFEVLQRRGIGDGDVLLVSDLNNEYVDFAAVTRAIERFEAQRIPVRVVALSATKEDERAFRRLLAEGRGFVEQAPDPGAAVRIAAEGDRFPLALGLVLAGVLLAAGASELVTARVPLTRRADA